MAAVIDLPFQDQIQQGSGPTTEGFRTTEITYGGTVSQISFEGPSAEASREEVWKIEWAYLDYATPEEVQGGAVDQVKQLREFYKQVQMVNVRYKPFELDGTRIWRVMPNTLKITQVAGKIFNASMSLKYLYTE